MIKKIFFVFLIVFSASNVFANIYAEGNVGGRQLGEMNINTSYGWGIYIDLNKNFLLGYSGSIGSYIDREYDSNEVLTNEIESSHFSNMGKIMYLYQLIDYQVYFGASVGFGITELYYLEEDKVNFLRDEREESCSIAGAWLEAKYDFNQHISIMSRFGYVYAFVEQDFAKDDKTVSGFDIRLGVTLSLFNNKRLY